MTDHITIEQMIAFRTRALSPNAFAITARHLAHCEQCQETFRTQSPSRASKPALSLSDLSLEHWLRYEHFDAPRLSAYVEDRLDAMAREMAEAHLATCAHCREELHHFRAYLRRLEPWLDEEAAPSRRWNFFPAWDWSLLQRSPAFLATGGVLLVIALLGLALWKQRIGALPIAPSPTPDVAITPIASPSTGGSIAMDTPTPATENLIASLNDQGREIALEASGQLRGVEGLAPDIERSLREVLQSGKLSRPGNRSDLEGVAGPLRGEPLTLPFQLLGPARKVLEEDRPTFRWEAMKGATGYQVFIGDLKARESITSEALPAETTSWTPPKALKRGRIYNWAVTAIVNGQEITSPGPGAAEWKFKILDAQRAGELAALRNRTRSHLALGIFYARSGMVEEAEQEFEQLAAENPRSPIATRLLRTVRTWR